MTSDDEFFQLLKSKKPTEIIEDSILDLMGNLRAVRSCHPSSHHMNAVIGHFLLSLDVFKNSFKRLENKP